MRGEVEEARGMSQEVGVEQEASLLAPQPQQPPCWPPQPPGGQ